MSPMRQMIARESRQVLFMGMETAWLAAALLMVDGAIGESSDRTGLAWLCVNYLPAYIFARYAQRTGLKPIRVYVALAIIAATWIAAEAWFIVAASLSGSFSDRFVEIFTATDQWKYALAAFICGGFVWGRGWFLAGRKVDTEALANGFQVGLGAMIVSIMLAALGKLDHSGFPTALGFFFAIGLSGIAWSRRLDSVQLSRNTINGPWAWAMPVSVILVLAVGLLGFMFLDRELLQIILQPVFKLWDVLVRIINYLLSLLPDPGPMNPPDMTPPPPPPGADSIKQIRDYLKWIKPVANVMFAGGSLTLVLAALFRILADILRFLRKKLNPNEFITVERLDYGFWDDLKLVFIELFRLPMRLARWAAARLKLGSEPLTDPHRIRTLYGALLKWGARIGRPKGRSETPDEYALRLALMLDHDGRLRLRALTDAFMRFRYSPEIPGSIDVSTMKTDLRNVKRGLLKKKDRPGPTAGAVLAGN